MSRAKTLLLSVLLLTGCASGPGRVAGPQAGVDLAAQFVIEPLVAFRNDAPPPEATSPEKGARFVYARAGSQNARVAPVDIEIAIQARAGLNELEARARLERIYQAIYGWDPAGWREELTGHPQRGRILRTKSNLFWESLAQQVAERVLGETITPPLYLYGPSCVSASGELTCPDETLPEVDEVRIKTTIDGRRDPLNPQTRSIVYVARRGQLRRPDVYLELHIPTDLRVAGPEREHLDLRPKVGDSRRTIASMRVLAHLPASARERTSGADYADYNLLFVPLRHLVFQGHVEEPKGPHSSLSYADLAELRRRFEAVVGALRAPETARQIAQRLRPFLTSRYYYMFDSGQGVSAYADYILGDSGVSGGISPDIGQVELIIQQTGRR